MEISCTIKCNILGFIVLSFGSVIRCSDVLTNDFRAIAGCYKDLKRTETALDTYYSVNHIQCAVACSRGQECSGFNYCDISIPAVCELMPSLLAPLPCSDLDRQDGCIYLHKGPCWNGGYFKNGACQCPYNFAGILCERYLQDCVEAYDQGYRNSPLTIVQPSTDLLPFEVKCRLVQEPSARIVKRSIDGTDHFAGKTWNDYKYGFGLPAKTNMWLGLEKIRQLLNVGDRTYTMRIAINFEGEATVYDGYLDGIQIASEEENYTITYSSFRTEGVYPLSDVFSEDKSISGRPFCTPDRDCGDCAKNSNSGWWFSSDCTGVNLNLPADELVWPREDQITSVDKISIDIFPI